MISTIRDKINVLVNHFTNIKNKFGYYELLVTFASHTWGISSFG